MVEVWLGWVSVAQGSCLDSCLDALLKNLDLLVWCLAGHVVVSEVGPGSGNLSLEKRCCGFQISCLVQISLLFSGV